MTFVIRSKEARLLTPRSKAPAYTYYVSGDAVVQLGEELEAAARFATKRLADNARKRLGLGALLSVSVDRAEIDERLLPHAYVSPPHPDDVKCQRCGSHHF